MRAPTAAVVLAIPGESPGEIRGAILGAILGALLGGILGVILCAIPCAHAGAPTVTSPAPRAALAWTQRLGEDLPLAAPFVDETGRTVALGNFFGRRPVALVLGYYRCPNLCTTLTEGVLETLRESGLPAGAYEVVAVSIDPREDSAIAARKKTAYGPWLRDTAPHVHLLTGEAASIAALTQAAGLRYTVEASSGSVEASRGSVETSTGTSDANRGTVEINPGPVEISLEADETSRVTVAASSPTVESHARAIGAGRDAGATAFVHPAGFLVVTPQGRIAQYFPGVRFDPHAVRLAVVDASRGGIGSIADRLLLLCSHYDPATGRYDLRVMQAVRVLGLLSVALLAAFIWHVTHRRGRS